MLKSKVAEVLNAVAELIEAASVKVGEHPDLFTKEMSAIVSNWKDATPDQIKALASNIQGIKALYKIMDEIEEVHNLSREDLIARGLNKELAEVIANEDLNDQLTDLIDEGQEERVEPFLKFWKDVADSRIEYETKGEGLEGYTDYFISELNRDLMPDAIKRAEHLLEEDDYPNNGFVTKEILTELLIDPDLYSLERADENNGMERIAQYSLGSIHDELTLNSEFLEELGIFGMTDDDLTYAIEKLSNSPPYMTFPSPFKERAQWLKGDDLPIVIGELEGDSLFVDLDFEKLTKALDEHLGPTPVLAEDTIVYKYAGTNDTVAGASARGMYVVDLAPSALQGEGAALGICVGQKKYGYHDAVACGEEKVYSIRTEAGKPKFTINQVNLESGTNGEVLQVKGKANRLPGFAADSTSFSKADEVRLIVEFLQSLGITNEEIKAIADMRPGILAMENAGMDPFTPPPVRKKVAKEAPQVSAVAEQFHTSAYVRLVARAAMERPWGYNRARPETT